MHVVKLSFSLTWHFKEIIVLSLNSVDVLSTCYYKCSCRTSKSCEKSTCLQFCVKKLHFVYYRALYKTKSQTSGNADAGDNAGTARSMLKHDYCINGVNIDFSIFKTCFFFQRCYIIINIMFLKVSFCLYLLISKYIYASQENQSRS